MKLLLFFLCEKNVYEWFFLGWKKVLIKISSQRPGPNRCTKSTTPLFQGRIFVAVTCWRRTTQRCRSTICSAHFWRYRRRRWRWRSQRIRRFAINFVIGIRISIVRIIVIVTTVISITTHIHRQIGIILQFIQMDVIVVVAVGDNVARILIVNIYDGRDVIAYLLLFGLPMSMVCIVGTAFKNYIVQEKENQWNWNPSEPHLIVAELVKLWILWCLMVPILRASLEIAIRWMERITTKSTYVVWGLCVLSLSPHILQHKQTKITKKTEIWNFHKINCYSCCLSRVNPLCAKISTKEAMFATKKIPANKFAWILSVCWLGGRWMMQLMLMLIECWKRRHLSAPHDPKLTHQSPNKWYTTIPIHRHIQLNR